VFSKEFQAERFVLLHDFSGESNFQSSKTILILLIPSSKYEEIVTLCGQKSVQIAKGVVSKHLLFSILR
jgi:hypothetical protein